MNYESYENLHDSEKIHSSDIKHSETVEILLSATK